MMPLPKSKSLVATSDSIEAVRSQRRRKAQAFAQKSSGLLNRILASLIIMGVLIGGLGGWSATAELSGAVIAPGQVVVKGSAKEIQHPTGGVVSDIRVRNGDRVAAGDILMTLDETHAGAQLAIIENKLVRLASEKARLEAERNGKAQMNFPAGLDKADVKVRAAVAGEQDLLKARMDGWRSQKARLNERIDQARKEILATNAQRSAKEREIALIRRELKMVEDLHRKQLANEVRLIGMQREVARFEGDLGSLMAQIARIESQIKEIELQIVELDQRLLTEAQSRIGEIETQIAELEERKLSATEQVKRTELRAPVSGIVHNLEVHTEGGVLKSGETAMLIVPDQEAMTVEVRVAPNDIDQVTIDQTARLRFTALNQRTTPELSGKVVHVGADLTRDEVTGRDFYSARIELNAEELAKLGKVKLVAGMPVEGYIATAQRTALSYLLKPLRDQLERAMTEE